MNDVRRPARPAHDAHAAATRPARVVCLVASLTLLGAAALGATGWSDVPDFPPPAANALLAGLRHGCVVALGVLGLLTLPWALRPAVLPVVGAALHAFGLMTAVATTVALRGEAVAPLFWLPAVTGALGCLAVVWAAARPGTAAPRGVR